MRILDLFCCAGGAAMGYSRAGFDVVGVDIVAQPDYPFQFVQGDALAYLTEYGREFDAVHASPPCQAFTTMSNRYRGRGGIADQHPQLIAPLRAAIPGGMPYVIENVPGAKRELVDPFTLDGGMFGLGVQRPRLFETNFPVTVPKTHKVQGVIGVYGKLDGRRLWTRVDGTTQRAAANLAEGQAAMGIDWMPWTHLTQAIPPAYTEFIGEQLMAYLGSERAA